ncbi:MAG: hypothetical protein IIZ78_18360 [Clostridiales bacterium]|nr:hypothetical protein [Clostridiales bacterium]
MQHNSTKETDSKINIKANVLKTNGERTLYSNNLEVSFQNPEDATAFQAMISELGIEDAPQDQLYLLEAMCFAGVSYVIE